MVAAASELSPGGGTTMTVTLPKPATTLPPALVAAGAGTGAGVA